MDIQKAYATVDWMALFQIMRELGFPQKFVNWVTVCVSTVSYKFSINGLHSVTLPAQRGLRQGDPISPLLFVIIMEYLYRVLRGLKQNHNFNFHPKCGKMRIINICFADDILLFARGDVESVKIVMQAVKTFSNAIGLYVSEQKSKVFFGGVEEMTKQEIQLATGFERGKLPFKYLGVPLDSKKLTVLNCLPLIDRMLCRIKH